MLFLFATVPSFAQEVDPSKISCANFSNGVYAMAQKVQEDPKITSPEQLLKAVGVEKATMSKYPEAAKLVTLAARMVLTSKARKYSPEDHQQGSEVMCLNHEGNIEEMNEALTAVLQHLETKAGSV